ncbi:uncharacterized protein LOC128958407 [Oppia nitens]|uniref:uncharacterized protein LOC128958407 n=1 Tax=Oppia nitens TaxID=1686743 RepID=UPI0023DB65A7|nr:uncharacterized protein LOC128958407 [Oppia nitens]
MPANSHTIHSQTPHASPYNYERVGTVSPTVSPTGATTTTHIHTSPVNHHQRQYSSVLLNGHVMNGNISSGRHTVNNNSIVYSNGRPNGGISPRKISPNMSKDANNITVTSTSKQPLLDISRTANGYPTSPILNGSRLGPHSPKASANSNDNSNSDSTISGHGLHEVLASLALMCLLSLLMAFLALFFLQKSCPLSSLTDSNESAENVSKAHKLLSQRFVSNTKEYVRVFQISVSLSTLTISLDLCCLFVSCIQFLSAVKLMKTPFGHKRTYEFLKKTSHIRVAAVGAFLISIPIFFTGVILFTFVNFDEVPALATSVIIGLAIVFCGIASVQNVYLWQWEKTKASQELSESRLINLRDSGFIPNIELSTLV